MNPIDRILRVFGLTRQKALMPPNNGRWTIIQDVHPGAWQQNYTPTDIDSVLTFAAVFACVRLIATDIGKLRMRLVELTDGIWEEIHSAAFSPVLRKPNAYQTRIKFFEQWVTSKLLWGAAFILKGRDSRRVVTSLRVLNPVYVQVLISDSGEVFYRLKTDHLAGVHEDITVPATEIIHDVHMTFEHPLVGVGPIIAFSRSANQGIKIQQNSEKFFENMSRPGGMLSAPGHISDDTATRLKTAFETNFGGDNIGKLAVAGDGLKFEGFALPAEQSQLIEQLRWTGEDVCRAFGVPAYKVGIGPMPAYNNIQALQQQYYQEALQEPIECIELLLDEGLELPRTYGTEFDIEDLLRMDSLTQTQVLGERVKAGLLAPDEGRAKIGLRPVPGGKYPYLQQQNYSLQALAKRDEQEDPFGTNQPDEDDLQGDDLEAALDEELDEEMAA